MSHGKFFTGKIYVTYPWRNGRHVFLMESSQRHWWVNIVQKHRLVPLDDIKKIFHLRMAKKVTQILYMYLARLIMFPFLLVFLPSQPFTLMLEQSSLVPLGKKKVYRYVMFFFFLALRKSNDLWPLQPSLQYFQASWSF